MTDVRAAVEVLYEAEANWDQLTPEERRATIDTALAHLVETGERTMESSVTGTTYRVTKWIDHGGGKCTAIEKTEVDDDA